MCVHVYSEMCGRVCRGCVCVWQWRSEVGQVKPSGPPPPTTIISAGRPSAPFIYPLPWSYSTLLHLNLLPPPYEGGVGALA